MVALADACADADYPAEIVGIISDQEDAPGLSTARARNLSAVALPRADYPSKADHEAAMDRQLDDWESELVCLAGFMRLLSASFVDRRKGRIINIHPSLLPRHKGLDTHRRALEAGDSEHGCTVHHVTAGIDDGPAIAQARVPILPGDTPETLADRVLVEEHRLYPQALRQMIEADGMS